MSKGMPYLESFHDLGLVSLSHGYLWMIFHEIGKIPIFFKKSAPNLPETSVWKDAMSINPSLEASLTIVALKLHTVMYLEKHYLNDFK